MDSNNSKFQKNILRSMNSHRVYGSIMKIFRNALYVFICCICYLFFIIEYINDQLSGKILVNSRSAHISSIFKQIDSLMPKNLMNTEMIEKTIINTTRFGLEKQGFQCRELNQLAYIGKN